MKRTIDNEILKKFQQGDLTDAYLYLGCHYDQDRKEAVFRVWAPRAKNISVVGDFNKWNVFSNAMTAIGGGIFEAVIEGIGLFDCYKYYIDNGITQPLYKSDPYAFHSQTHEFTASKVARIDNFVFDDADYLKSVNNRDIYNHPMNIYEAHIGSWRKYQDGNYFDYVKFADEISKYLSDLNYTHLELMGVAEYPFDGSWGYQVTGYFAPTSRYGSPDGFAYLVNKLHSKGIGVILDWVPGHFPKDANGLYEFDGFPLYEPEDDLKKEHKEWGTRCFDYGRGEVLSFLISNAMMWLDVYHVDGLRVDAVASMLYLDYGRQQWRPNQYGGKENLDAVAFFQKLNTKVFEKFPNALMIAEESTAWPGVTKPVDTGGLGFNFKWNMGWMNDNLSYIKTDPFFRGGSHNKINFSLTYAFSENYILPISHDEVVHGKGSLLNKMPGSYEEKFAGLRNFMMNMYAHPGKKLMFMGGELGQFKEWNYADELDWPLLEYEAHRKIMEFVKTLNKIYVTQSALFERETDWSGFEWLVVDDYKNNVIAFKRNSSKNELVVVINYSPVSIKDYEFGVDKASYTRILYSDVAGFTDKPKIMKTHKKPSHNKKFSLKIDIEPYCGIYMVSNDVDNKSSGKSAKEDKASTSQGKASTSQVKAKTSTTKTTKDSTTSQANKNIKANKSQKGDG